MGRPNIQLRAAQYFGMESDPRTSKLYQTDRGAMAFAKLLRDGYAPPGDEDSDAYACCSGRECGCRGITNAEAREQERERYSQVPPLTYGPVIEFREVHGWRPTMQSLFPRTNRTTEKEQVGA